MDKSNTAAGTGFLQNLLTPDHADPSLSSCLGVDAALRLLLSDKIDPGRSKKPFEVCLE